MSQHRYTVSFVSLGQDHHKASSFLSHSKIATKFGTLFAWSGCLPPAHSPAVRERECVNWFFRLHLAGWLVRSPEVAATLGRMVCNWLAQRSSSMLPHCFGYPDRMVGLLGSQLQVQSTLKELREHFLVFAEVVHCTVAEVQTIVDFQDPFMKLILPYCMRDNFEKQAPAKLLSIVFLLFQLLQPSCQLQARSGKPPTKHHVSGMRLQYLKSCFCGFGSSSILLGWQSNIPLLTNRNQN